MSALNNKNKITIMPVGEYIANKYKKLYGVTYRIRDGKLVAIVNRGEMSLFELDELYPTPSGQLFYFENCDKTKNFFTDRKSF